MHSDTSCPANNARINCFVHILFHLSAKLFANAEGELKLIGGRGGTFGVGVVEESGERLRPSSRARRASFLSSTGMGVEVISGVAIVMSSTVAC